MADLKLLVAAVVLFAATTQATYYPAPVNGGWSNWGSYGPCSSSCGGGVQRCSRKCNNPAPANGGKNCVGPSTRTHSCNTNVKCPVNGGWSNWSGYRPCDKTCGGGRQRCSRTCTKPAPANGGRPCPGPNSRSRPCNKKPCYPNPGWSRWGPWGPCTKTCGIGSQTRQRKCNNPAPAPGQKGCVGPSRSTRKFSTGVPCPALRPTGSKYGGSSSSRSRGKYNGSKSGSKSSSSRRKYKVSKSGSKSSSSGRKYKGSKSGSKSSSSGRKYKGSKSGSKSSSSGQRNTKYDTYNKYKNGSDSK